MSLIVKSPHSFCLDFFEPQWRVTEAGLEKTTQKLKSSTDYAEAAFNGLWHLNAF